VADVLCGQKVVSFFYNTLDPDDSTHVTIDGHMYNAYNGRRVRLVQTRKLSPKLYKAIAEDIRSVAATFGVPAPRFQSVLWLVWKRTHRILWTPQLSFDWSTGE
jgi:hypothetical protein